MRLFEPYEIYRNFWEKEFADLNSENLETSEIRILKKDLKI